MTDAAGSPVKVLEYDSVGLILSDSNPSFDLPIGFAGGLTDPATGLVRFGLRDYDPRAGRWTSRDPVLFTGSLLNLYSYVNNNPVAFVDPTGMFCIGGSAYYGVGGGTQVCFDEEAFSVCGELGIGIGGGVDLDLLGGRQPDGSSVSAEVSAGPLGGKLELNDNGQLTAEVGVTEGGFGGKWLPEAKINLAEVLINGAKPKIQAKLAGKVCGGGKW